LEANLETTTSKLENEKEAFKNVDIQKSKHGSELESVEAKLQFLNSNLNQFKKFKSVDDRNRYLESEIKQIGKKANQFENLIKNTQNEIRELNANKNDDLRRSEQSKQEIHNLETTLNTNNSSLSNLKQKESELTEMINKEQHMNAEIKHKVESLHGVLENKRKFWRMAIGEY